MTTLGVAKLVTPSLTSPFWQPTNTQRCSGPGNIVESIRAIDYPGSQS